MPYDPTQPTSPINPKSPFWYNIFKGVAALGEGIPGSQSRAYSNMVASEDRYAQLKQEAEQWRTEQRMKLQEQGYQDIGVFPGGNPKDFQTISIPGGETMFRKADASGVNPEQVKAIMAEAKLKAYQQLPPEMQKEYALNGRLPSKPSEFDIDKLAFQQATTLAGGSLFAGLTEEGRKGLLSEQSKLIDKYYKKYLGKSGGASTAEEEFVAPSSNEVPELLDTNW